VSATALKEPVSRANATRSFHDFCLVVVPALNEEETVGDVVRDLRRRGFRRIRVIDNGSSDGTASHAARAGADVLMETRCGYGRACLRGLTKLPRDVAWILFCDADGSDNLGDVDTMIDAAKRGADLVLTNRFATEIGRKAMTPVQRLGNRLISELIEFGWGVHFSDFGPLRLIRRQALDDIPMRERGFGWNVVMQIRAIETGLRIVEVPAKYWPRQGGRSKISGNPLAAVCADFGILQAVARLYFAPRRAASI
jgi:glycosyltransferase involved in cell wall biosynthesis